jgi:sirohydrochlorin cobaltochelatase
VVLVGHGAPATDCPPQWVGELMELEWRKPAAPAGDGRTTSEAQRRLRERVERLDAQIRDWPRHAANDPYKTGLERVAAALRPLLPMARLAVGYNEFCRPSIGGAIAEVIEQGAARVLVIPSMLTPGGLHAERDIPQAVEASRAAHPGVAIEYVWPFDLGQVAALLAVHLRQAIGSA